MNCPVCSESLREIERYAVRIDICPGCKGIWLDRGEIDKIIELAAAEGQVGESRDERLGLDRSERVDREHRREHDDDRHGRDDDDDSDSRHRRSYDARDSFPDKSQSGPRRRSSWLGGLLEGFGGGED